VDVFYWTQCSLWTSWHYLPSAAIRLSSTTEMQVHVHSAELLPTLTWLSSAQCQLCQDLVAQWQSTREPFLTGCPPRTSAEMTQPQAPAGVTHHVGPSTVTCHSTALPATDSQTLYNRAPSDHGSTPEWIEIPWFLPSCCCHHTEQNTDHSVAKLADCTDMKMANCYFTFGLITFLLNLFNASISNTVCLSSHFQLLYSYSTLSAVTSEKLLKIEQNKKTTKFKTRVTNCYI